MVLLFTTVMSASMVTTSASSFTPRLSAPSYDNSYYYSSKNIFYSAGYGMPNCTAYAFGRAYEILGYEPSLSHSNAQDWYGYNQTTGAYSYGSTPAVGAIACWSYSGGGHVAVVEKIENGTVTYSNSAWGGTTFYTTTSSVSNPGAGGNSWWNFQGFIYILGNGSDSDSDTSVDTDDYDDDDDDVVIENRSTSDYSTGTYEVTVDSTLNIRQSATTSSSWIGSVPDGAKLNITDIDSDSSYVWGYTTYNGTSGWVALDYCSYVGDTSSDDEDSDEPEDSESEDSSDEEVVEVTDDSDYEESIDEDIDDTEAEDAEATEEADTRSFVLYFANNDTEETGVYPLDSEDQTVEVELKAGEYSIFMEADNERISSTYTLTLTVTSSVSVAFDESEDYFDIHVTELEEAPVVEESTPDTAVADSSEDATSDTASVATSTSDTAVVESTNGAVQTGGDFNAEAVMVLTFSVSGLALIWFKRRLFF